jgi:protein involved in sex pheromone biosynthesis
MKTFIIFLSTLLILSACGNNKDGSTQENTNKDTTAQVTTNNTDTRDTKTINDIVSAYLNLKNSLTNDNPKEAAGAAKQIDELPAAVK